MIVGMDLKKSKLEALLESLAEWQAAQDSRLDTILSAGQMADVRELERMYALQESHQENAPSRVNSEFDRS